MKAENIRELLNSLPYKYNGISWNEASPRINAELKELERLADIGRATELAYEKEFCITNNGWQEIYLDTVEELLEWAKEQTK